MARREKKPVHRVEMTEGKDSVNSFAQILKSPCSG